MAATAFERAHAALNRVAKWRVHYAGWQLGTRPKGDPTCDAVRDHRELSLIMRVELNALVQLLLARKVFTPEDLANACADEANAHCLALEKTWPGIRATDEGLMYDKRAVKTMHGWLP